MDQKGLKGVVSHTQSDELHQAQFLSEKLEFSPIRRRDDAMETEEPVLVLMPFSSFPYVSFGKVKVGSTKVCSLIVSNPLCESQDVKVIQHPSEKGFHLQFLNFHVNSNDQFLLKIVWKPTEALSCREKLLFQTSKGCKSQAYLLGTAFCAAKNKKLSHGQGTKSSKYSSNRDCSKLKEVILSKEENKENTENEENLRTKILVSPISNDVFTSNTKPAFYLHNFNSVDSPIRRQTYLINNMLTENATDSKKLNECDSKLIDNAITYPFKGKTIRKDICLKSNSESSEIYDSLEESPEAVIEKSSTGTEKLVRKKGLLYTDANPQEPTQIFRSEGKWTKDSKWSSVLDFDEGKTAASSFDLNSFASPEQKSILQDRKVKKKPAELTDEFKYPCKKSRRLSLKYQSYGTRPKLQFMSDKKCKTQTNSLIKNASMSSKNTSNSTIRDETSLSKNSFNCCPGKVVKEVVQNSSRKLHLVPRKLCLIKSNKIGIIRQKNPYATTNAYYDERWMQKQELAFTRWLNFILTPTEDFISTDIKVDAAKIWVESLREAKVVRAPTKETLSLQAYTAIKKLNELRRSSCELYHSEEIVSVIRHIEKEVDLKKISVRKDRATHADLGIKQRVLELLLGYNPLWLRIGLETIYGEIISLRSNAHIVGLSRFIIQRFLNNPDIAAKYAHSNVTNLFKPGYEDAIKSFTLKRFLLLVFFLDKAKTKRLINHNPCLFCKNAEFKSSRDLLLEFSREYLSGEGDITRHLRYIGYNVCHKQIPLEEFDYSVTNLSTDLRCGIRLGRVMELVLNDLTILPALRMNTISLLQKIHNNGVALKALQNANIEIDGNIQAKDIVDGNREKTLSLLWQIIFKTQILKLLNIELIKEEIAYLQGCFELKVRLTAINVMSCDIGIVDLANVSFETNLYADNEILQVLLKWCQHVCKMYNVRVHNFSSSFSDGLALCFLLHHYQPEVLPCSLIKTNTTKTYFEAASSEACLDEAVEGESVKFEERLRNERENLKLVFEKFGEVGQIPLLSTPEDISNTIPDEKVIITLVSYINIRLMNIGIEIKAARKIQLTWRKWRLRKKLKKLEQAAVTIQCQWRKYSAKNILLKSRVHAAVIIQAHVRGYLQRKRFSKCRKACIVLQKKVRALKLGKETRFLYMRKKKSAVILQAAIRGWITRRRVETLKSAAILIQSNFRSFYQRKKYLQIIKSVICIQVYFRSYLCTKTSHRNYLELKSAIKIQSVWRAYMARVKYLKFKKSVIIIQKQVSAYLNRKKQLSLQNEACVKIQSAYRRFKAVQKYNHLRQACLLVQRKRRIIIKNRQLEEQKKLKTESAVKIQTAWRAYIARVKYLKFKKSVIIIQKQVSAYLNRKKQLSLQNEACVKIQSAYRRFKAVQKYNHLRQACLLVQRKRRIIIKNRQLEEQKKLKTESAVKIQTVWRAYIARVKYLKFKKSVIIIQKQVSAYLNRKKQLSLQNEACVKIQSAYRRFKAVQKYNHLRQACLLVQRKRRIIIKNRQLEEQKKLKTESAVKIQTAWRAYIARVKYLKFKKSVIIIQKQVSAYLNRKKQLSLQNEACVKIQSAYRRFKAVQKYNHLRQACLLVQRKRRIIIKNRQLEEQKKLKTESAVKIQTVWRAYIARVKYLKFKKSVIIIQKQVSAYLNRKKQLSLQNEACVKIQSAYRRFKAVQKYNHLRQACLLVQRKRRIIIKNRQLEEQKKLKTESAVKIQTAWRAYIARVKYLKFKKSVIIIQKQVSAYLNRKKQLSLQNEACVKIQSAYRQFKAVQKYNHLRQACLLVQRKRRIIIKNRQLEEQKKLKTESAVKIQTAWRAYIARVKYLKFKKSVIIIQKQMSAYLNRKKQISLQNEACVKIQSAYRGFKVFQQYNHLRQACLVVQRQRRLIIKNRLLEARKKLKTESAVKIQTAWRAYIARIKYLKFKKSVIIIQKQMSAYLNRKKQISLQNEACVKIQSAYRGFKAFQRYNNLRQACLVVQRQRTLIIKNRLLEAQKKLKTVSAVKIQTAWRAYIARVKYLKFKKSVIIIQKQVSAYLNRKKQLSLQNEACVKIQSAYRRFKAFQRYNNLRQACLVVQRQRRLILKNRLLEEQEKLRLAAEHQILAEKLRRIEESNMDSVILIQHWWRSCRQHFFYLRLKKVTIKLQRKWRQRLVQKTDAAVTIQSFVRMIIVRHKIRQTSVAATKIQAMWRAYCVRKKIENDTLTKARIKIKTAESSEHMKLGNRTRRAITMLKEASLRHILVALQILDVSTRLSPCCCENLAHSDGIDTLLRVVSSCNRSVPHIEIIRLFTNIALNIAKFTQTVDYLWNAPGSYNTVLNLINIFKEKNTEIFLKNASIIWIFCQDQNKAQVIREDSSAISLILRLHTNLLQQQRLKLKPFVRHSSNSLPDPPRHRRIEPDWVLGRANMHQFADPLVAISSIKSSLGLH